MLGTLRAACVFAVCFHVAVARTLDMTRMTVAGDGSVQIIRKEPDHAMMTTSQTSVTCGDDKELHVAVLISGQAGRFVYQDSLKEASANFSWLICGTSAGSLRCTLDVYILLGKTPPNVSHGVLDKEPPYGEKAFTEEAIKQYYKQHGANRVNIAFVSKDSIDKDFHTVETLVKKGRAETYKDAGTWWKKLTALPKFKHRWEINGRMLLLRHMVFFRALKDELELPYNFSHFLYLRDDNVFVDSVSPFEAVACQDRGTPEKGFVAVDKHCAWHHFTSDKMYFADRRGGMVLFGATMADHVEHMTQFLDGGFNAGQSIRHDPLQSERFLHRMLYQSGVSVEKYEFSRTEVRYYQQKPCVFELYFKCTREPGRFFPRCPCSSSLMEPTTAVTPASCEADDDLGDGFLAPNSRAAEKKKKHRKHKRKGRRSRKSRK